MKRLAVTLLLAFACDGEACTVPTVPDAGLLGDDEPCTSLWQCKPWLTCQRGTCQPPEQDPYYCDEYGYYPCPSWAPYCVGGYCQDTPSYDDASPGDAASDAAVPDDASDAAVLDDAVSGDGSLDAGDPDAGG